MKTTGKAETYNRVAVVVAIAALDDHQAAATSHYAFANCHALFLFLSPSLQLLGF